MADKSKLCFVVGPVGSQGSDTRNHADLLLEFIIKPVLRDFPDYLVKRQDEDSKPGMIDSQIITALRDADLVIADLSHLNPNAFYEIGIRHMIAKPIIHMQLEEQRIPFDLSLYKTVPFSFVNPSAYSVAQAMLKAQISEATADGYTPDNPVTRALGQQHLKQTTSPDLKVISDTLQSLGSRLAMLEDGQGGNALAGIVKYSYTVRVQTDTTNGDQSGLIASHIVRLVPKAMITKGGENELLEVRFSSTPRRSLEILRAIELIPGVVDTSGLTVGTRIIGDRLGGILGVD